MACALGGGCHWCRATATTMPAFRASDAAKSSCGYAATVHGIPLWIRQISAAAHRPPGGTGSNTRTKRHLAPWRHHFQQQAAQPDTRARAQPARQPRRHPAQPVRPDRPARGPASGARGSPPLQRGVQRPSRWLSGSFHCPAGTPSAGDGKARKLWPRAVMASSLRWHAGQPARCWRMRTRSAGCTMSSA